MSQPATTAPEPRPTNNLRMYPGTECAFAEVHGEDIRRLPLRLNGTDGDTIEPGDAIEYLGSNDDDSELHAPIDKRNGSAMIYEGAVVTDNGIELALFTPRPKTTLPGWFAAFEANDLFNPGSMTFPHIDGRQRYVRLDTMRKAAPEK